MSTIPPASDMLYAALPKSNRDAVDKIVKMIKKRSRAGVAQMNFKLSGSKFYYNAIARLFAANGYSATVAVNPDGTTELSLNWKCFCAAAKIEIGDHLHKC